MKFKSAKDGSTWAVIAVAVICCVWPLALDASLLMAMILLACLAVCIIPFFSIRYEIDGGELVVYALWRPSRYPISKIREIAPTKSILSAPATSLTKRLAITFTDRTVMKSAMPLVISPADSERFIKTLLTINPAIQVRH